MQTNIGRCHYGRDDDATLIGARVEGSGWIGVCDEHRDDAEREGYVLHVLAVDPDRPRPAQAAARRSEQHPDSPAADHAGEPSIGLDILDDPYPPDEAAPPLR